MTRDAPTVTRDAIRAADARIRRYIRKTPVIEVDGADFGLAGVTLVFKLELFQHAGSFKARGAFANLLLRDMPAIGVAAASGGNHGAAVAFAAQKLGVPARIFVPEISTPAKIARIRQCGADLVVGGARYADALDACDVHVRETGALSVHAFDAVETMCGAGTLGLELDAQAPDLDAVVVAVGGGGLIGGVSAWFAGRNPKVIAAEPELAPTLNAALAAGAPVDARADGIAADSLAPKRIGAANFPIIRDNIAAAVLVPEAAIIDAQKALWDRVRVVAEPGGACALAALLAGRYRPSRGARVGVVVSGGNTSAFSEKTEAGLPAENASE